MFYLAKLTIFSSILPSVFALVVPRSTPPGWYTDLLEPYDTYHTRYLALSCHTKHDTAFFDQCCHPLLRDETLRILQAQCFTAVENDPGKSMPTEASHSSEKCDEDQDGEDSDDCGDDDENSSIDGRVQGPSVVQPATQVMAVDVPAPKDSAPLSSSAKAAGTVYTGGYATYYYQHGNAGACGKVHSDYDMIAAIDQDRYGDLGVPSGLCGRSVRITNTKNSKGVTVLIADACPTCRNSNSIDLSEAAFKKIASLDEGIVPIKWNFV